MRFRHRSELMRYKASIEREAELWGEARSGIRFSWFESPMISRYINRFISGDPECDWLDYIKQRYFSRPAPLGLNVGCGHGKLDHLLLERGLAHRIEGFDISPKAVKSAREQAQANGLADRLRYFVADANFLDEASIENQYDMIMACMALHHFAQLEKCLDALLDHLKPGGYFITNEYIGPNRFQWTDAQLKAANGLLRCLPSEMKRDLRRPGEYKLIDTRPTIDFMRTQFPFEAVCSERIIPALRERFKIMEQKNYGGTVLHILFEGIIGNFDEETNREHMIMIRFAIECERLLLDSGVLPHDHALVICRKPLSRGLERK